MTGMLSRESDDDLATARRSARRTGVVAGVVALIAVLVWLVVFSSVLGVKRIAVHGTHLVKVAQVLEAGQVPHGVPLVRLDTGKIARRVEKLPVVAAAHVHVSYPSTVVITVTERVAVGYLSSGDSFVLVDRTGVQFRTVSARPAQLPRFDIPAGGPAAVGQAVATAAGALSQDVLRKLSTISATDPSSITLHLTDGRAVVWGSADRSADKAQVLPALLARPGTTFDVSDPDVLVAR